MAHDTTTTATACSLGEHPDSSLLSIDQEEFARLQVDRLIIFLALYPDLLEDVFPSLFVYLCVCIFDVYLLEI